MVDKNASRIICKKCGKDVEFTKTVTVHLDCPRCKAPLGRDLKQEGKDVNRSERKEITYAFLRQYKKYFLFFALIATITAITLNCIFFFTQVLEKYGWTISVPFVVFSLACSGTLGFKSSSRKIRVLSWIVILLNAAAIACIIMTSIPSFNDSVREWYN